MSEQRDWLVQIAEACDECGLAIQSIDDREIRVIRYGPNGRVLFITVEAIPLDADVIRYVFGGEKK
jgi:hypothetical protein